VPSLLAGVDCALDDAVPLFRRRSELAEHKVPLRRRPKERLALLELP
jgi:hypothetical protein